MKKLFLYTSAIFFTSMSAYGEESTIPGDFSGTLALTSDYTFRGIAQSDKNPALQGSLTYTIPVDDNINLYGSVWGSGIDFNDGDEATIELDYAAGIGYTEGNFSLDTGIIYYDYPGADKALNYNYYELQITLGYNFDPVFLRGSVNYSPNMTLDSGSAFYYKLAAEVKATEELKLFSRVGYQTVENNVKFGFDDYMDWGIGATYNIKGVDLTAEFISNNINKTACANACDSKLLFTIAKSF